MAGTGRVQVLSKTPIGYNQYDVTISFDIAFDWGGWNSGAYYTIYCNGQSSSGNASFSMSRFNADGREVSSSKFTDIRFCFDNELLSNLKSLHTNIIFSFTSLILFFI